jgi:hypothetical protein
MEASAAQRHRWQFGLHPAAAGSVIRTMTRMTLPIGDALRIEMSDATASEPIHVQYHIATDSGGWALWISSAADEVDKVDASLPDLTTPADADSPA